MANTRFQLKRSSVSGVTPTTSDIASGELGVNLADRKLFTSNGSAVFELGSNLTNISVTSNLTVRSTGTLVLSNGAGLYANGSVGSSGQLLASNGTGVYWTSATGTGSVTSVDSGSGLTGGPITTAGTLSVLANNGIAANSAGVFVVPGTGVIVNTTGVHINSSFIETLTANAAGFLGNSSGTIVNITSWIAGNSATAYTNATNYADTAAATAYANAVANAAAVYQTAAGLAFQVATLAANSATYLGNSSGTIANIVSWITGNAATAYANAVSHADIAAGTAYANAVANAAALYQTTAGLSASVLTLTANAAGFLGNSSGTLANVASWITGNSATAYSNAASYADTVAGAAYANAVANAAALYQTTAGLSANVATLAANSATYLGNSSGTLANIESWITGNSATAYSNATSYADTAAGAAYANAVANAAALYQTTAGLSANVATLTANAAGFLGNSSGTLANVASWITSNADAAYTNAVVFASNASNINTGTIAEARLPFRMDQNVQTTSVVSFAGLTVTGNLTVNGQYVVVAGNSVVYSDNMLYLNQGVSANITNITSNGTHLVFTANNNYQVGWDVSVTNVNPSSYNGTYLNITAANSTSFTVANTNTDSYVSGGVARGKSEANPDLGFAAGYNDGSYKHAGFFRDHSSGVWKVFDGYLPEPDTSVYIDQTNASFTIAKFQASEIRVGNNTVYGVVNTTNFDGTSNAATYLGNSSGTIGNITSWITGNAAAAYTNATVFASNASNINTGTVDNARLSAQVVNTSGSFTYTGVQTFGANVVLSAGLSANGGYGSNGQVLTSNGTGVYWANASGGQATTVVSEQFVANGTANSFTVTGGYTPNAIEVYVAGVKQTPGTDVLVSSGNTINFAIPPLNGQVVDVFGYKTVGEIVPGGTVTSISAGSGLTGGQITTVGTLSVLANTGIIANTTGVYVDSSMFVNTSGNYAITGVHTHTSNLVVGNTTVNTELSNATILLSNSISTTTLGLTDLRLGNTTTNVVISNTTSSFGGNVVILGSANVTGAVTISTSGQLVISNGAGINANGSLGAAGQVLTSNSVGVYWANIPGVDVAAQYSWTNTHSFAANLTIAATGGLIISNGAGIYANGTLGTSGQVLTSNGTGVTWANNDGLSTSVRQTFIANSTVNTSFTISGGYTIGYVDVYRNGVKLVNGTDVAVSDGATVVLASAAASNDVIDVVGFLGNYIYAINTAIQYTWTDVNTYTSNLVVAATGGLIISNGAGVYANGTLGSNGQVLASNGTGVAWTTPGTLNYRTITANTTILSTDNLILANGTLIITLPAAATVDGRQFYIKNINNSNGVITILPSGSELIDGYANATIRYYNTMLGVISVGTGWVIF